jgi:hypothetical protein
MGGFGSKMERDVAANVSGTVGSNAPVVNSPVINSPKNNTRKNNTRNTGASSPRLPPSNANNGNVEAALPGNISTEGTVGNANSRRGSNASNITINKNNEVGVNVPNALTGGRRRRGRKTRKARKSRK